MPDKPEKVYRNPLDWRLLETFSAEFHEWFARMIVRDGLFEEAEEFVRSAGTRRRMGAAYLLTRLAARVRADQRAEVSALIDLHVELWRRDFRYGTLFVGEYLMLDRHGDEKGMERVLGRWCDLAAGNRVPSRLWLPLLRGEDSEPCYTGSHEMLMVTFPSLPGDDEDLRQDVMSAIFADDVSVLAFKLLSYGEGRGKSAKAALLLSYLLRNCKASQVREVLYLFDEFMQRCSPKRMGHLVNDRAVMSVRLADYREYVNCFILAGRLRRQGLLQPNFSLCPCRFDHLRAQRKLFGNLTMGLL